jgi:hypothetical protein
MQRKINNGVPYIPVMQRMDNRAHHHIDECKEETDMQQPFIPWHPEPFID